MAPVQVPGPIGAKLIGKLNSIFHLVQLIFSVQGELNSIIDMSLNLILEFTSVEVKISEAC